jgi:uncharacterized protein (TIRG00374 family)
MRIRELKDNKYLWFVISTAIIAGLIYFAGVEKFIDSISHADPGPLLLALLAGQTVFVFWGYTWYRIFHASGIDLDFFASLETFMAGQFMNSITPLGQFGGEPVMAYLVRTNSDASYEKSLSSVFSADMLNATPFITFTILGALYLAAFGSLIPTVRYALYSALVLLALGGFLAYLLWFKPGTVEKKLLAGLEKGAGYTQRLEKYIDVIEEKLQEVQENFERIGEDPVYLANTAAAAHIGFMMQVASFYLVLFSLGFTPSVIPVYFIVVFSSLASFTPTPGGSGAYEAAMAGMVELFLPGIGFTTGLTAAILYRGCTYWGGILIGWTAFNNLKK